MENIIIDIINHWIFKLVFGAIFTGFVGWAGMMNKKIKNSASKDDVEKGLQDGKQYTREVMKNHETTHKNIDEKFDEIRDDNARIEGKIDKLLLIMIDKK